MASLKPTESGTITVSKFYELFIGQVISELQEDDTIEFRPKIFNKMDEDEKLEYFSETLSSIIDINFTGLYQKESRCMIHKKVKKLKFTHQQMICPKICETLQEAIDNLFLESTTEKFMCPTCDKLVDF